MKRFLLVATALLTITGLHAAPESGPHYAVVDSLTIARDAILKSEELDAKVKQVIERDIANALNDIKRQGEKLSEQKVATYRQNASIYRSVVEAPELVEKRQKLFAQWHDAQFNLKSGRGYRHPSTGRWMGVSSQVLAERQTAFDKAQQALFSELGISTSKRFASFAAFAKSNWKKFLAAAALLTGGAVAAHQAHKHELINLEALFGKRGAKKGKKDGESDSDSSEEEEDDAAAAEVKRKEAEAAAAEAAAAEAETKRKEAEAEAQRAADVLKDAEAAAAEAAEDEEAKRAAEAAREAAREAAEQAQAAQVAAEKKAEETRIAAEEAKEAERVALEEQAKKKAEEEAAAAAEEEEAAKKKAEEEAAAAAEEEEAAKKKAEEEAAEQAEQEAAAAKKKAEEEAAVKAAEQAEQDAATKKKAEEEAAAAAEEEEEEEEDTAVTVEEEEEVQGAGEVVTAAAAAEAEEEEEEEAAAKKKAEEETTTVVEAVPFEQAQLRSKALDGNWDSFMQLDDEGKLSVLKSASEHGISDKKMTELTAGVEGDKDKLAQINAMSDPVYRAFFVRQRRFTSANRVPSMKSPNKRARQ